MKSESSKMNIPNLGLLGLATQCEHPKYHKKNIRKLMWQHIHDSFYFHELKIFTFFSLFTTNKCLLKK